MDIIFIPTKYRFSELKNFEKLLEILPKNISVVYIKQYEEYFKRVIGELERRGYNIIKKEGLYGYSVLGCYSEPANTDVEKILLIGDGEFHAKNISRKYKKKVIIYNPISGEIKEIYEDIDRKIKILISKLKESNNIGLIISIKPGQYYINEVKNIKEMLEKCDKKVYMFLTNEVKLNELKNFPFIDFWIVFACPRIIDDILENNVNAITFDYIFENKDLIIQILH